MNNTYQTHTLVLLHIYIICMSYAAKSVLAYLFPCCFSSFTNDNEKRRM